MVYILQVLDELRAWAMDFGANYAATILYNLYVTSFILIISAWVLVNAIARYLTAGLEAKEPYRTLSITPEMTRTELEAIFGTPDRLMFERVLLANPKSDLKCLRRIHPELYQAMKQRWKLIKRELSQLT